MNTLFLIAQYAAAFCLGFFVIGPALFALVAYIDDRIRR